MRSFDQDYRPTAVVDSAQDMKIGLGYDALGNASQQVIWMDGLPVGLLADGVLHYIEPDHLGTPRLVFNPMRNVPVWTWDIKGGVFCRQASNSMRQVWHHPGELFRLSLNQIG